MSDELLVRLAQLRQQTAAMQTLLRAAEAAMPRQAAGSDASGTVQVTSGPDGLPVSFRVGNDWQRRLQPEALGAAVLAAFQASVGQRMVAWSDKLATDGWQNQLDQLKAASSTTGPAPTPGNRLPDIGTPRPLDVSRRTRSRRSTGSNPSIREPVAPLSPAPTGPAGSRSPCPQPGWSPARRTRAGRPTRPPPDS